MAAQDVPNPLIHKVELKPGGAAATKTKLDQIMEEREENAAKRYSAATLEAMALEAENEARRLKGEPPKNGVNNDNDDLGQNTEKKVKVMNSAKALLDAGMDPADVGRMLLNMPPATSRNEPIMQSTNGMGVKAVITLVDMISGKRDEQDIKALLINMNKRLEAIESGKIKPRRRDDDDDDDGRPRRVDPVTYAKQQIQATSELVSGLADLGLIQKPGAGAASSIEMEKEKNRHEEQMLAVKSHADYEHKLADTVASIPEQVGVGIGKLFLEDDGDGKSDNNNTPALPRFKCECGNEIVVPPNTKRFKCPKCGAIYEDKPPEEKK